MLNEEIEMDCAPSLEEQANAAYDEWASRRARYPVAVDRLKFREGYMLGYAAAVESNCVECVESEELAEIDKVNERVDVLEIDRDHMEKRIARIEREIFGVGK